MPRRSTPTIASAPAGALPIDAEADERAVMLVGGEASLDSMPLEPLRARRAAPGRDDDAALQRGGKIMLMAGGVPTRR
jgi:hypothetical protein